MRTVGLSPTTINSSRSLLPRTGSRTANLLLILILLTSSAVSADVQRLTLEQGKQLRARGIRGSAEISIVPPFENPKVQIFVDGQLIATRTGPPYNVEVDLGGIAVERRVTVVAVGKNKRAEWTEVINEGQHPLSVKLAYSATANTYEATVTAPDDDPVVEVEFYDGSNKVGTLTSPPYRFTLPDSTVPLLYATAKSKSGAEASDYFSHTGDIHVESYEVRSIPIFVSVTDQNGSVKDDLDRASFRILDNGSEAKILEFGRAFDQPISIALIVDASASMTYHMPRAVKAAQKFVEGTVRPQDSIAIFSIQSVPRRLLALTPEVEKAAGALTSLTPTGHTALFDAVASAIRELKDEKNRRAIVVFSDGADNMSNFSFNEIFDQARNAGIPVYVIAFGEMTVAEQDFERMKLLASETGGFVSTASAENLEKRFEAIEQDLRAQYAIKYQVTAQAKRREWRAIRVVLKSPKLTARTIRGYFTP